MVGFELEKFILLSVSTSLVCFFIRGAHTCKSRDVQKIAAVLEEVKDWEKLAKLLDISGASMNNIKENCAHSQPVRAQCYRRELVETYCDSLSSGDPNRVALDFAHVLESEMGKKKLAQLLKESFATAFRDQDDKENVSMSPSPELSQYAEYLRAVYSTSPVAISDKFPHTPSKMFIKLAFVKKEKLSQAEADAFTRLTVQGDIDKILQVKEPIEMDDILKADDKVRLVVVEGAPGIGKSTLAWELCRQWSTLESLKQFSLVVLHKLREQNGQSATDISDLFPCEDDPELSSLVAHEVKRQNGKGVLFVFDGFDEFPHHLRQSLDSIVMKVIAGKLLPKATVLVTSRPSATADLQSVFQTSINKHIEIVGFSGTEIQNYAESIFGKSSKTLASFNAYLSTNPLVKGMMYNPLNCAIVVGVYQDSYMTGKPIPHTQTQLYTELTLCLLSRSLNSTGDPLAHELPDNLEDIPHDSDLYQQLVKVGQLAYEGKFKDKVIFHQLPEGCSDLGLLVKHTALYTRKEKKHYSFFHVTLQEYMSAFYISQLQDSEQRALFNNHTSFNMVWKFVAGLTKMRSIGWDKFKEQRSMYIVKDDVLSVGFSLIQYFYEAQDVQSCESVFDHYRVAFSHWPVTSIGRLVGILFGSLVGSHVGSFLFDGPSECWPWSYSHLFGLGYVVLHAQNFPSVFCHLESSSYQKWLYSVHMKDLYEHFVHMKNLYEHSVHMKNLYEQIVLPEKFFSRHQVHIPLMTLPDYFALGYCISACSNTWNITILEASGEALEILGHGMKSVELGGSIDKLDLFWSEGILNEGNYLFKIPRQILRHIKSLKLSQCGIDQRGFENLAECIPYLHSLTSLDISINPGGNGSLGKPLQALKKHRKLRTLNMQHVAMGMNDVAALADLLQPSSSLRELVIGNHGHDYSSLSPDVEQQLVQTVLSPSSLETLWVRTDITHPLEYLETISDSINTLSFVSVSHKQSIPKSSMVKGGTKLSHILRKNTSLKELMLHIPLDEDEVCDILESLNDNQSLEWLILSNAYHSQYKPMDSRVIFE